MHPMPTAGAHEAAGDNPLLDHDQLQAGWVERQPTNDTPTSESGADTRVERDDNH